MKKCGIDEAGRGCIVGPLVICGAMIDADKEDELKSLGVKDSKLLSASKRNFLFNELPKHVTYQLIIVPPQEIDKFVLSETGDNLNWLEAQKSVELINMLEPDQVILDSPSPNLKAYKSYVEERLLHKKVDILVEHKADHNHPICAAASVFAKVTRDRELQKIKDQIGEDFGSGYMADPKTKSFLQRNWDKHPLIFRHSWTPYQKLLRSKKQKGLNNF